MERGYFWGGLGSRFSWAIYKAEWRGLEGPDREIGACVLSSLLSNFQSLTGGTEYRRPLSMYICTCIQSATIVI